jgi:hypothetical protein
MTSPRSVLENRPMNVLGIDFYMDLKMCNQPCSFDLWLFVEFLIKFVIYIDNNGRVDFLTRRVIIYWFV